MADYEKDERTNIGSLDIYQMKAITFIDQKFFGGNELPTPEKIAYAIGVIPETVEGWFQNRQFCNALRVRGIDLSLKEDPEVLDPRQAVAAHLVFNTEDRRSLNEKLDDLGVSMAEWNGWINQPRFRQYLRKRALQLNDTTTTFALIKLEEAVQDGDFRAIEMQLRMANLYRPGMDININVQSFVISIVEIIQKHVQDPSVIQAIAEDIDKLEQTAITSG